MKKYLLFFFLVIVTTCYSQTECSILAYSGMTSPNEEFLLGGIETNVFINDYIQFNYALKYGKTKNDDYIFQTSLGSLTGLVFLVINENWNLELNDYAIFIFMIPEGLSFNIPIKENTVLTPFINLLSIELRGNNNGGMFYEGGIKFKRYLKNKKFFASCNIGMKSLYRKSALSTYAGGTLGFVIDY